MDFTGVPSGVMRITCMFDQVSTNGTSQLIVQIGDSGGFETTGYNSGSMDSSGTINSATAGFAVTDSTSAAYSGTLVLNRRSDTSNTWVMTGTIFGNSEIHSAAGRKLLSDTLTQVRFTTEGGTDTFDGGIINIVYE